MSVDDVLEINVGGMIFTTVRSTLCLYPDSMLANLFDPETPFGIVKKDSTGRPFLDSDGEMFYHILGYLRRGGQLAGISSLSSDQLDVLARDADYFGLSQLVESIKQEQNKFKTLSKPAPEYQCFSFNLGHDCDDINLKLREMARQGWRIQDKTEFSMKCGTSSRNAYVAPKIMLCFEREKKTL